MRLKLRLSKHRLQPEENPTNSHGGLASYSQSSPLRPTLISPPTSPLPAPAAPPCSAYPQEPRRPLNWSDTTTYPRRQSSQRRLSYPRGPAVRSPLPPPRSYGSVTMEQSHMEAPLQRRPNPQRSQRSSQRTRCELLFCSWSCGLDIEEDEGRRDGGGSTEQTTVMSLFMTSL